MVVGRQATRDNGKNRHASEVAWSHRQKACLLLFTCHAVPLDDVCACGSIEEERWKELVCAARLQTCMEYGLSRRYHCPVRGKRTNCHSIHVVREVII